MTLDQWLPRFLLHPQSAPVIKAKANAAVMLLLYPQQQQLQLLLTRRALHLRHHPGQISFPGGRIEAGESELAAAIRECEEEIGIAPNDIKVLGSLPSIATSSGFIVSPWVGLLKEQPELRLQQSEVAAAFNLPLSYALSNKARNDHWFSQPYKTQQLHFLPYQGQLIWGATAAILHQLAEQIYAP
jgi:8-oxo-dGTP pyrophosphatase MutT (NUDIX family)